MTADVMFAPHLAPESQPRWRARLEGQWCARLERLTELSLRYHEAAEAGGAAGPAASRPLLRQAVVERRALAEIEAALSRLASGRFGRCERCGDPVAPARLRRAPQVRYCGSCDVS